MHETMIQQHPCNLYSSGALRREPHGHSHENDYARRHQTPGLGKIGRAVSYVSRNERHCACDHIAPTMNEGRQVAVHSRIVSVAQSDDQRQRNRASLPIPSMRTAASESETGASSRHPHHQCPPRSLAISPTSCRKHPHHRYAGDPSKELPYGAVKCR